MATIALALRATVTNALDGPALEAALLGEGPFALVVTAAQLQGRSGLQVLARARSLKLSVPFIVVMSIHGHLARVMVSDASMQTLSSRMVDRKNLANLVCDLVRESNRPAAAES